MPFFFFNFDYDKASPESILNHARKLLGNSVRGVHPDVRIAKNGNKGGLGQIVEKFHFGYENNSISLPDFPDAGVELKCTPLKKLCDGSMISKERLVLNVIDYMEEDGKSFSTSSFKRKNAMLLLMFYLHLVGVDKLDYVFKIIRLWSIPKEDLKIFMDDWAVIHDKIMKGLAHELHGGDTLYLEACPKGEKKGKNLRKQPYSRVKAPQRAFAIKSSYLNQIILDSLTHPEMVHDLVVSQKQVDSIRKKMRQYGSIVRSRSEYKEHETFEHLVVRRFAPYLGKSVSEIERQLEVHVSNSPKAMAYALCRAILGVKAQRIAEFEKAGVNLKTIRLEYNKRLKEAMSFSQLKYKDVLEEKTWEDSAWHEIVTRRFFFVVFRKAKAGTDKDAVLERVLFWGMPSKDLPECESMWKDTVEKIRMNDYCHFRKQSDGSVCHIRPKAKNKADMMETPQGGTARKLCYWFNREYVLNEILGVKEC